VKISSVEVFVLNFPFKAAFVLAGGVAAYVRKHAVAIRMP
jgi:hypothetical protein